MSSQWQQETENEQKKKPLAEAVKHKSTLSLDGST